MKLDFLINPINGLKLDQKENKVEFINSLPFNFDTSDKIFDKKPILSKSNLFFKEYSLIFDSRQIYEGGFFVMIGKK